MLSNYEKLDQLAKQSKLKIADWIEGQYGNLPKPIYSSVDIRNSGFKIAHVDANVFPSGFNNTCPESRKKASQLLKDFMQTNFKNAKNILIVPENFTRNINYLKNLKILEEIFIAAGYMVKIASPYTEEELAVAEINLHIFPIKRTKDKILAGDFEPDLIILNNDLTAGFPDILKNIEQSITPDPKLGWFNRRKHKHFEMFSQIAHGFAIEFGFDSWLISPLTDHIDGVDFRNKQGLEIIAEQVEKLIKHIHLKYVEHAIKSEPFVFIKSDMGTYGLGIMPVRGGDEVIHINKKHRHSMDVIKHGVHNSSVIIQEGVPTIEKFENHSSETMAYLVNGSTFDLIERVNQDKDATSNLNSHGMYFKSNPCNECNIKTVIASLATLAIARE